jgi:uncharacterized protein YuzE
MMDLSIDHEADAGYLRITDHTVARTDSYEGMNFDLDADGWTVGVEFLSLDNLKIAVGDTTFVPRPDGSVQVLVPGSPPVLLMGQASP